MVVMATGELCPQRSGDAGEAQLEKDGTCGEGAAGAAAALHERLVAYVRALSAPHEARCGVWVEHSYARGAAPPARALLAPRPPALSPLALDVCASVAPPAPPAPLDPDEPAESAEDEDEPAAHEDEWEARVLAAAAGAAHARLGTLALDALRRMRLERLAGAARAGSARTTARRLRLALAGAPGPAGWLHAALEAHAPARVRRLYAAALAELRRAAPAAAGRLGAGASAGASSWGAVGAARASGGAGPWLAWLGCGRARADARWTRRLGALVHVRVLTAPEPRAAPPDGWCATVASSLRAALDDVFAEAGERCVFVGGCGAGAALAVALGGRARGLVLVAPPARDAEGEAGGAAWRAVQAPLLAVTAGGAAARALCRAPGRRLLEVRGADAHLRLPRALRTRLRLPQHALDAAIAEECARWMAETAEGRDAEEEAPPGSPEERPPPAPPALAAADILRLPIVFADDAAPPPPVTVTSGGARYTRVIVASRSRGTPPAPGAPAAAGAQRGTPPAGAQRGTPPAGVQRATPTTGAPRAPRPVLLRRVMPRAPR